jgi:hypothetical protein
MMSVPAGIIEVALRVARALEEMEIEYVLGGSLASGMFGEPRSTRDIDFGVRMEQGQVEEFSKTLGPDFSVDEVALREAIRTRSSENIFFLPQFFKVDLFVSHGEPFDESEFQRRKRMAFADGRELYVASAEDTLLRKLTWFRLGEEVSDQQWRDVLGILRVSGPALDRAYLTLWAERLGVADLLIRALAQA